MIHRRARETPAGSATASQGNADGTGQVPSPYASPPTNRSVVCSRFATTLTFAQVAFVPVLDDIAPLSRLGAPPVAVVPWVAAGPMPPVSDAALLGLCLLLGSLEVVRLRKAVC